jgi:mycolic acid cyclopropane synthetase
VPDTRQPGTQSVGPRPGRPSALVLVLHGGSAHGHGRAHSLRLAYLRMLPFARLLARAGSAHGLEVEMVRYRYRGWNAPASDSPVMRLIRPDSFYRRLGANALIGFGEAYLVGGWTSTALADLLTAFAGRLIPPLLQRLRRAVVPRTPTEEHNTIDGARDNIRRHYDLSNELFAAFLDETMTYSSAWFADGGPDSLGGPEDLAGAQLRKINGMLDLGGRPGPTHPGDRHRLWRAGDPGRTAGRQGHLADHLHRAAPAGRAAHRRGRGGRPGAGPAAGLPGGARPPPQHHDLPPNYPSATHDRSSASRSAHHSVGHRT